MEIVFVKALLSLALERLRKALGKPKAFRKGSGKAAMPKRILER